MKIDAKVQSISKLKDYFFLVPDYQREYVWKPDDEVEQFLIELLCKPLHKNSYANKFIMQSDLN